MSAVRKKEQRKRAKAKHALVEIHESLSYEFRSYRFENRLTQVDAGRIMGVSQATICKMERDSSPKSVGLLLHAFLVFGYNTKKVRSVFKDALYYASPYVDTL